ncbi:hypothetical protein [Nostoc sp.]|uniref:hypothetical protein n=1 Tax=Nostoc sp. TaxID=1180 RepID=UPI002FF70765
MGSGEKAGEELLINDASRLKSGNPFGSSSWGEPPLLRTALPRRWLPNAQCPMPNAQCPFGEQS